MSILGMIQDVFNVLFICQHSFYLDYGNLYESWCIGYGSDEKDDYRVDSKEEWMEWQEGKGKICII